MLFLKVRGVRLPAECAWTAELGKNCENIITFLGGECFRYPHLRATIMVLERPQLPVKDLCDFNIESGPMNERSAKFLFRQVVKAVRHCHAYGVVHGDVKSENVLVEMKTGRAVLIDFGNAFRPERLAGFLGLTGKLQKKAYYLPHKGHWCFGFGKYFTSPVSSVTWSSDWTVSFQHNAILALPLPFLIKFQTIKACGS